MQIKGRGAGGDYQKVNGDHTNFLLMWGCRPSMMVLAETTMVENLVDTLQNKFDRINLSIKIPFAFEQLKGSDASFEMVTSNTIQSMSLLYQHNIVFKRHAAIFVNTDVNDLEWTDAIKKGERAKELFRETFEFREDQVEVLVNLEKQAIIAKFDQMQTMADEHE